MIPHVMIILPQRLHHRVKGRLSYHHHPMQSFLSDRAHEPFAVGIEFRAPWRQDDRLPSTGTKHSVEDMRKFFGSGMQVMQ
jgi:hypothetical protein